MRVDLQGVAVDRQRPDDHFACANQPTDFDHRRAAQSRRDRQMEILERADPLVARDRRKSARAQFIGKEHRRCFRQPLQSLLVSGVFKGHDQDAT